VVAGIAVAAFLGDFDSRAQMLTRNEQIKGVFSLSGGEGRAAIAA
jgi:hypothetical protein